MQESALPGRHHDRDSARRASPPIKIAEHAEFFSFGTNDLTQTTMGLSRDDYTKFSKEYENLKIFKADPFASHRSGRRRQADRDGHQAGPQDAPRSRNRHLRRARRRSGSVEFCYRVGMNYVSCSPYRVPIARLAAAQAAISGSDKSESMRTA